MRRRSKGQKLDGILLLDKRSGISSNHALQEIKRLMNAAKAGHTGSLDPLASGLLPVCFGQATRLSAFILETDKKYRVDIRLGLTTTTGDAEGEIKKKLPVPDLDDAALSGLLRQFTGPISQIPPMYSALKRDGVRLYEIARQGLEVERKPRTITIYNMDLLEYSGDKISLDVTCSKGTYIRTLAEDIGESIGCGGYVENLRRIGVGCFDIEHSWTIDRLQSLPVGHRSDQCLLPMDQAVANWPRLEFAEESVYCASHGQAVEVSGPPAEGWVRMYTQDSQFFGVGEVLPDQRIAPRKLFLNSTGR